MKRVFFSILAGLMMLSMFTGCSSSQNSSAATDGEKTVVELWTVWKTDAETGSGKVLREAAEEFMAQNPDIVINISNQGGYDDIAEKLEASIVAKNPPTLATVEETHVQRFSPVAADLSQYLPAEVIDNYVDGLMHTCTIDGVVKAVPFGRSSTILYMNKNLVEAAGLSTDGPKTWEEFYQYAEAMTDPENGVYGWGQDFDTDAWIWESMLYSYGGEIISDDLKTVLFDETPASYEIVETMQDMADAGTLFNPYSMQGEAWDILKSKFIEGKIGMLITSIASSSEIQRLGRENGFETVLAFQPMGTEYSVPTGGNNIIMFESASDAEKEAAAKFLEFLASDEIAAKHNQETGYFPVTETSMEHSIVQEHLADFPSYQKALDQLQYAHSRPMTKNWKNMYTVILDELKACMTDTSADAKAAIESAAEKCQKILDENPD